MEWKNISSVFVTCCNTFGLHLLEYPADGCQEAAVPRTIATVLNCDGQLVALHNFSESALEIDLKKVLNEEIDADQTLELVNSDMLAISASVALIATSWVVNDKLGLAARFFSVLFRIDDLQRMEDAVHIVCRLDLETAPSFCNLCQFGEKGVIWLIFTSSKKCRCISYQPMGDVVEELNGPGDVFAEFNLGIVPGAVLRYCKWMNELGRWSAFGCDTGYVAVSLTSRKSNQIISKVELKLSGPISVLELLSSCDKDNNSSDCVDLVICSTLGPAVVWKMQLSEKTTNMKCIKRCILDQSARYDCVLCSVTNEQLVCIGTYGRNILVYRREEILKSEAGVPNCSLVQPIAVVQTYGPVLSMKLLPDNTALILSSQGLHTYSYVFSCSFTVSNFADL